MTRSLLLIIAGCLAGLMPACATAQPAPPPTTASAAIRMEPFGTQPAVLVRVNGRGPYLFLLDTGASGVARIDSSLVQQLGLPVVGRESASGATGGAPVPINRVAVRSLELGGRTYRDLTPLSRSYNVAGEYVPDIGGILALNLFADQLLTIDFPNRQVRIEPGDLPEADGVEVLDYEARDNLVRVPITLAGRRVTALVDTGTDRAIDLPTSLVRQIALASFPHPIGRAAGVTGEVAIAEAAVAGDLVIGGHRIVEPAVTFAEAFEYPILGSVFFHDFVVTIDQRNRRIRLVRPAGR